MSLDYSAPSPELAADLAEVRASAAALSAELEKSNAPLPADFPKPAVGTVSNALRALPDGTARGCLRPLTEALGQLATIRSQHIRHESPTGIKGSKELLPLFRGEPIDQKLSDLIGSVSTALQTAHRLAGQEAEPEAPEKRFEPPSEAAMAPLVGSSIKLDMDVEADRQQLEDIRKPESQKADTLKRRLVDVQSLNSTSLGELQMPQIAAGRLSRIASAMNENAGLVEQAATLIKTGTDIADYAYDKWHSLKERLFKATTRTIREVAEDLSAYSKRLTTSRKEADPTNPDLSLRDSEAKLQRGKVPPGWEIVDRDALANIRANPPTLGSMVQFFDGILPTWRLVLAPGVLPRTVVERLANRLRAVHARAAKPQVVLLAGAGGEGKSTALLHTAAALVEDTKQVWTCLHRQAANAELPDNAFSELPAIPGQAWVVVIDDADNIGSEILAAVKKLRTRTDVHVLLAARDADWQLTKLVPRTWQFIADFHTELLAGLDEEDARRIVAGWIAWGGEAMGKLKGRSEGDAIAALLGHARDFATRKEDGELLGALLVTRQGEDMRAHVRTLINGLGRSPVIKSYSLRDIYAMVAAMHAENQLYLSRSVLAFALGCDIDELEREALIPLRREAMLDSADIYVLTRHRRIAEAACAVMREDAENIDRWYPFLTRAALLNFTKNFSRNPNIQSWNTGLANHFVDKDERWWPIARTVAQAAVEAAPGNAFLLTAYSSILRRTGRAPDAMIALKATGERYRNDRIVLYEWSAVAGEAGDYGLNAWLSGRTLADGGPLEPRQGKLSLAGLGVAFRGLFATTQDKAFITGQAACGQFGLRIPELNFTDQKYFENYAAEGRRNGIAELSPEQAVDAIRKAVILGANEVEPVNDPVFFEKLLGDPEGYRYTALLRMVVSTKAVPQTKDKPDRRK